MDDVRTLHLVPLPLALERSDSHVPFAQDTGEGGEADRYADEGADDDGDDASDILDNSEEPARLKERKAASVLSAAELMPDDGAGHIRLDQERVRASCASLVAHCTVYSHPRAMACV